LDLPDVFSTHQAETFSTLAKTGFAGVMTIRSGIFRRFHTAHDEKDLTPGFGEC
jgi:hypothetical protein